MITRLPERGIGELGNREKGKEEGVKGGKAAARIFHLSCFNFHLPFRPRGTTKPSGESWERSIRVGIRNGKGVKGNPATDDFISLFRFLVLGPCALNGK
jgi:hypothetical protein